MDHPKQRTLDVFIGNITADPALQPRVDGLDLEHVRALEAVAEAWPPLKAVFQDGRYLLVDGFHRFAAAQNLGLETVPVLVLDLPEDGDLHGLAFSLNAAHGRPLNLSDRRAFAARLLQAHSDWSDREIGRRAGLVQPTIAKIRSDLESKAKIEPAETRIGRDGRSYTASQRSQPQPASGLPDHYETGPTLIEKIADAFTPADRRNQREIVRYLQRLAIALEDQEKLKAFETITHAADACRAVLGEEGAAELAARLGWSARNIVQIAEALGDDPDAEGEQAGVQS